MLLKRSQNGFEENFLGVNPYFSHFLGPVSPTYVLEHLATFTVSPENDLVYPADGMRRLLAMEKTNGIWTQKMLMKIERNMIVIMDNENKVDRCDDQVADHLTEVSRVLSSIFFLSNNISWLLVVLVSTR